MNLTQKSIRRQKQDWGAQIVNHFTSEKEDEKGERRKRPFNCKKTSFPDGRTPLNSGHRKYIEAE